MTVLATTHAASLLPPGRLLTAWHASVSAEVTQYLSPAHATLLARPEQRPDATDWTVPDAEWRRHADLPAADRDKLLAAVQSIRSDIRRLAESGVAPAVAAGWPVLWTVPNLTCLFAVAGRPVLVGWSLPAEDGTAGTVLDRYDDGLVFVRRARKPWPVYIATLVALALFALVAGPVWPLLGLTLATVPARCTAAPRQLALMREQGAIVANGDQLRTLLAALTADVGRRQLQCPLRTRPTLQPTPTPRQHHVDLPQNLWAQHDLTMLEGCWTLRTQLAAISADGHADPVRSWKMCFGRDGYGQQTELTQSGKDCQGSLVAAYSGDNLRITMPERCTGSLMMNPSELQCQREGDSSAHCNGRNLMPNDASQSTYEAQFQR